MHGGILPSGAQCLIEPLPNLLGKVGVAGGEGPERVVEHVGAPNRWVCLVVRVDRDEDVRLRPVRNIYAIL